MRKVTATRYHDISCGHRVHDQGGKCENLHGHNYRIHFTIQTTANGPVLDRIGRVLDFSVIKSVLCEWLEENWDHKMLMWKKDPMALYLLDLDKTVVIVPFNPTAENMAMYLVEKIAPELFQQENIDCSLIECTIDETRKCSATYYKG